MRRTIFGLIALLLLAACSEPAAEQPADLTGDWHGSIAAPEAPVQIGLHLATSGGTVDVPAKGLRAVTVKDIRFDGRALAFNLPDVPGGATFDGALGDDGTISGNYHQGGQSAPLELTPGRVPAPGRPQEPQAPFPYRSVDVAYPSANLTLTGTLTLPEGSGPFATVLLINGSGAQDRDGTIAGHKPFLLLADTLTRAGYAVLRVDDRGTGGSSGDLNQAAYDDLVGDVLSGLRYLRGRPDIDPARIGLLGHGEGGYLAPLAAERAAESGVGGVAFVVLLAAPAVAGEEVLVLQNQLVFRQEGAKPDEVAAQVAYVRQLSAMLRAGDYRNARQLARARISAHSATLPESRRPTPEQIDADLPATPAVRSFLTYDPAPALKALGVPVLAVYGGKDLQVPAAQSEPVLRSLLVNNKNATIQTFPELNHLMQPTATGAVTEYAAIETTMAPEVLDLVSRWVRERT